MDLVFLVPVIVITGILAWLFSLLLSGPGSEQRSSSTNFVKKRTTRKTCFSDVNNASFVDSDWVLMSRLGLSSDSTNVVTLALDSQDILGGALLSEGLMRNVLGSLSKVSNLFLVVAVSADAVTATEECVLATLTDLLPKGFPEHRVMFHQSEIGKIAVIRQLKPILHIDFDPFTCEQLAAHIRSIVQFSRLSERNSTLPTSTTNWTSICSLQELLSVQLPVTKM